MAAPWCIALALPFVVSQSPSKSVYDDILPVSRIRPGMTGYGLTVFRGTRIERFAVTVAGVVRNGSLVAPGHDMILVRMSGGPMTGRKANLIRGMSGSPVYIAGKCIGAFSQGEPTTKEPLGGVTPIEDMLEAWDPRLPTKPVASTPSGPRRSIALDRPLQVGDRRIERIEFDAADTAVSRGTTLCLRPCTTYIAVSGVSKRWRARLSELLSPYGVETLQGSSGKAPASPRGSLQPGAAFSVMLLSGDVTSSATGTITYRRGNQLLGFGHPLLGVGALEAPICTAYVHDVYPLNAGSYKISSPGPAVGTSTQDRAFSLAGVVGRQAATVPIQVDVNDRTTGRSRTYKMQSVRHPNLTAGLIGLAAGSAIEDMHGTPGSVMAQVTTTVQPDGLPTIERRNTVYDSRAIDVAATTDLESIVSALTNNPFGQVAVRSVALKVDIEPGRRTATIERAFLTRSRYAPGDEVEVGVVLKPYQQPAVTRTMTLRIPEETADGRLILTVRGGGAPPAVSLGGLIFRPSTPSTSEQSPPTSVQQMISRLLERETNTEISARLALPSVSVSVEGDKLTDLPQPLDAVMRSGKVSSVRVDRDELRATMATDWYVTGQQALSLAVQKHATPDSPSGTTAQPSATVGNVAPGAASSFGSDYAYGQVTGTKPSSEAQPALRSGASRQQPAPPKQTTAKTGAASATQPPTQPAQTAPEKPVGRQVLRWRQTARADMVKGEMSGVAVGSDGSLRLTRALRSVCRTGETYVWSLCPNGEGGVIAGTGPNGAVLSISGAGDVKVLARLPETNVHAVARTPDGVIYAGTGPRGRTYKIAAGQEPRVVHEAGEPYVLSLALDSKSGLWIGTGGGKGSVYRLDASGQVQKLADALDEHVMAIAVDGAGAAYAGTSGHGLVVRIASAGSPVPLFDAPEASITALALSRPDRLLAATAPRGILYELSTAGGAPTTVWDKSPGGLMALTVLGETGTTVAAGPGTAARTDADDLVLPLDIPPTSEIVALTTTADGAVWAGLANPGEVLRAAPVTEPVSGTLESTVLDAKTPSRWGRLTWSGDAPKGSGVTFHTRSGATSQPGTGWTAWEALRDPPGAAGITTPMGRFLQYRATLTSARVDDSPAVREVTATYLPANQRPKVVFTAPAGGEFWSGRQTAKWEASDPDGDTLSYSTSGSSDGGVTWMALPAALSQDAAPKPPETAPKPSDTAPKPDSPKTPAERGPRPLTVAQVTAELDRHPDLPTALREAILERARKTNAEYTAPATATDSVKPLQTATAPSRETSRLIDTSKLKDGVYRLRVVASDRPSNGPEALSTEAISEAFVICNTPPVVAIVASSATVQPDKSVALEIVALQSTAPLSAAQWRCDGGEWTAASAADGALDGSVETIKAATEPLPPGKHEIEVRVYNAAGLYTSDKTTVEVK